MDLVPNDMVYINDLMEPAQILYNHLTGLLFVRGSVAYCVERMEVYTIAFRTFAITSARQLLPVCADPSIPEKCSSVGLLKAAVSANEQEAVIGLANTITQFHLPPNKDFRTFFDPLPSDHRARYFFPDMPSTLMSVQAPDRYFPLNSVLMVTLPHAPAIQVASAGTTIKSPTISFLPACSDVPSAGFPCTVPSNANTLWGRLTRIRKRSVAPGLSRNAKYSFLLRYDCTCNQCLRLLLV